MREIKFRAKTKSYDTSASYWITGLFLKDGSDYLMNDMYLSIDPETIGQFIGILDSANVEIYENDIVELNIDGKKQRAVVEYRDGCFYPFNGNDCGCCSDEVSWLPNEKLWRFLVIGNLTDNPELKP
jgi:hypothetical protein